MKFSDLQDFGKRSNRQIHKLDKVYLSNGEIDITKRSYKLLTATFLFVLFFSNSISTYSQSKPIDCETVINLPEGLPAEGEIRFAAVGDTGRGNDRQKQLAKAMEDVQDKTKFNLLLFLGDNVYRKGKLKEFEKKLYAPYRKLRDERGVMIRGVLGNHDIEGEDINGISAQRKYFKMCPINVDQCDYTYYSFNVGNIDFFALDSNLLVKYKPSFKYTSKTRQNQIDWLATELLKSKEKNNWQVVFMHHIFYSSSDGHGINSAGKDAKQRNELKEIIPVLNSSLTDLVLSGHDHIYEKINAQKADPKGVFAYFISGAGALTNKGALRTSNFQVCGDDKRISFMLFSVKSDTMTFWAIDSNGQSFDSGIIPRK